jgi:hypothetical protein
MCFIGSRDRRIDTGQRLRMRQRPALDAVIQQVVVYAQRFYQRELVNRHCQ